MDVVQHGVGLLGLGVLLGLAGGLVDHNVAVLVLQGLAGVGVDDVLQGLGVELAGSALAGSIGQADAGVTTDIVVEAQILSGLAHDLTVTLSSDTSSLVLGVHHVQVKSGSQLAGELGAGPTDQFALLFGLAGISVNVINDLAKSQNAGANLFCHCSFLHIIVHIDRVYRLSRIHTHRSGWQTAAQRPPAPRPTAVMRTFCPAGQTFPHFAVGFGYKRVYFASWVTLW